MGEPGACDLESKQPLERWYTSHPEGPYGLVWGRLACFYLKEQKYDFRFLSKGRTSFLLCLFAINLLENLIILIGILVCLGCYMIYKQ